MNYIQKRPKKATANNKFYRKLFDFIIRGLRVLFLIAIKCLITELVEIIFEFILNILITELVEIIFEFIINILNLL
jgi:hypothetical protein